MSWREPIPWPLQTSSPVPNSQDVSLPTAASAKGPRWLRLLSVLAISVVVIWLLSGFYSIDPNQTGIVLRFGTLHERPKSGMHYALPWPVDRVYKPSTQEVKRIEVGFRGLGQLYAEPRRSDVLTGDENILKINMVVQYKISQPAAYLFRVDEPRWLVERTVESALMECIAKLPVDDVLTTAKGEIEVETIQAAQAMLDAYDAGITLHGGNLQEVSPPAPVIEAFNEVASAKKDRERKTDEAREDGGRVLQEAAGLVGKQVSQARAYYADRTSRAMGNAARFLRLAEEVRQARAVTMTRLYLETMERLLSGARLIIFGGDGTGKLTVVDPIKPPVDQPPQAQASP